MRLRLTIISALATLLGSICLYPFFDTAGWFWSGAATTLAVAAAGLIVRRFRVPAVVNLLAGLVAVLLCVNLLYASHQSLLVVIPTPASVSRLADLISQGWHDIDAYAAPVPLLPGISLLTGLGIGLVALLVDFLAVRLRRAAPAGLPLLAMYSIPAEVRQQSVHWLAFLLGAAGYLALLLADSREQLSGWGRPVFTRRWSANEAIRERPDSSTLAISGRRIGLTAVIIAVIMPVAIPGLTPRSLFGGGTGGTGSGKATISPDPLVSLRSELLQSNNAAVLTYHSTDAFPDYLRMYALDQFDGQDWSFTPFRGDKTTSVKGHTLPAPQGLTSTATQSVTTKIKINSHVGGMEVLPMPYPPVKVSINGNWRVTPSSLMIFSLRDSAGGRSYTVQSRRAQPTAAQLEVAGPPSPEVAARDLGLPKDLPPDVTTLAESLTKGADTPYDKAVRLQQWFTKPGNFTYSLNPPALGGSNTSNVEALQAFLFQNKVGYCQQFAASMAVLARVIGIPARVAVGYTAGSRTGPGDWVVRTADTHAWPELYFQGVGWLRFEPTPAGLAGQGNAMVPAYALPSGAGLTGDAGRARPPGSVLAPGASASPGVAPPHHRTDSDTQNIPTSTAATSSSRGSTTTGWYLGLLVLLLLLLAVPFALHAVIRRHRWAHVPDDKLVAHAAWDETRTAVFDLGLDWRGSDSPRAAADRLTASGGLDDAAGAALARLAEAEEMARYARSPGPTGTLRADARTVRTALFATANRSARWRARLAPPSSMAVLRNAGTRLLELANRLDGAAAWARRRLSIRSH